MTDQALQPLAPTSAAGEDQKIRKVVLPGQTPEGQHILSVLVKRSYDVIPDKRCVRAKMDQKLFPGDVHYGDPMNSAVKFESDFVPFKLATDVVLNGTAYSPNGKPAKNLLATMVVGQFRKDLFVIGDRVCRYREGYDPIFTDPQPFTTMEIRYERAYGGVDIYSDPKMPCVYPRNHLGRGFVINNSKKAIENLALPNIEDPKNALTPQRLCAKHFMHWERQPMPQGLGWFSKYWQPRAALAGVMPADRVVEQELRQAYAAAVPPAQRQLYEQTKLPNMDFRFFNGASSGLAVPFLSGGEEIHLVNLTPEGKLSFQLSGERPHLSLDLGMGKQEPPVVLHTLMIRLEDRQVDLVWRAAAPYPGPDWLPEMKKMEILIQ